MIIFESARLIIQELEETDLENFFRLNGDEEIMRYIRKPRTREECEALIKETVEGYKINPGIGRFAVIEKSTGNYIGSFALIPLGNTNDFHLGYAILKEYQGKGFATEITKAAIPFVFNTIQKDLIKAITISANIPSKNVLLKAGFIQNGTMIHEGDEVIVFELYRNK